MKGHQELLNMRMEGFKPRGVWVYYGQDALKGWSTWDKSKDNFLYPEIEILETESLQTLDLRFAIELDVHISTKQNLGKANNIFKAFKTARAKQVFVSGSTYMILPSGEILDDHVPE